ncbi:hypothetical protein N3K66_006962 [Trichothecium roseum]|uniref:Uncharacterized protein n=1 Tax=Trichothecium roseum TaxID=47278 RepID=A0ACC0UWV7_9HYPO|nr:hypothetical protein N3K66_006962 [Trichothecium roseum]
MIIPSDQKNVPSRVSPTGTLPSNSAPIVKNWSELDDTVPWPGSTYIIIERGTDRAITITEDGICLREVEKEANDRWLCVGRDNYFGFYNEKKGVYMGHDGDYRIQAMASALEAWEMMLPVRHPDGGYQLLMPHWWHTMMIMTIGEDGDNLVRAKHATTSWVFFKV